ncbi:phage tail tape measure protein [Caulobacter sp. NIBR2454]|uniref:phage tail tape measure protein n=1 Tax=Caulobacter sp. NIBR2454 TaxID=3015996 RepID=UPI0022B684A4|nr:phage tail tape measure protein [Caulobacter sp. NIBR2454]
MTIGPIKGDCGCGGGDVFDEGKGPGGCLPQPGDLDEIGKEGEEAGKRVQTAFEKAAEAMGKSLSRAARDGKISMGELAQAVIGAVGAAYGDKLGGLGKTILGTLGGLFSGARADGGPVVGGGAYLVGERGPEVFRPHGAGTVEPLGAGGGMTVNVMVQGGGAEGLVRSEAQIAQALARAVSLGARRA